MRDLFNWYPPAETYIPLLAFVRAVFQVPDDFELDMKRYLGVDTCVLGISGRALLSRLLMTLKNKSATRRMQVLIPGYTCYTVAASVARAGLTIACYDLDPLTFEPDMDSVQAQAGSDTLAIIGQHLFGIPTPMEGLADVSKQTGAYLIEDAAQGFGGTLRGMQLGSIGDFGLFSFGRGKPLPLGSGGALIGDAGVLDELTFDQAGSGYPGLAMAAASRFLSCRGIYWLLEKLPLGLGKTVFDPGFLIQSMPKVIRCLGACSLKAIDPLNAHRNAIADIYRGSLGDTKTPPAPPESRAVFTRFPVMAGEMPIPKSLYQLGVRRMYPKAFLDEPSIHPYCAPGRTSNPGASRIAEMLITLPTHMGISSETAREIAAGIREAYSW